jgi:hypothetical protein
MLLFYLLRLDFMRSTEIIDVILKRKEVVGEEWCAAVLQNAWYLSLNTNITDELARLIIEFADNVVKRGIHYDNMEQLMKHFAR